MDSAGLKVRHFTKRIERRIGYLIHVLHTSPMHWNGYLLPLILGGLYQLTGSYTPGFLILCGIALISLAVVCIAQGEWKRTWVGHGGTAEMNLDEHVSAEFKS